MLKRLFLLFIYFPVHFIFAQQTTGKVYNESGMMAEVYVQNITRGEAKYTNAEGDFSLDAQLGDSLAFSAPFYVTQKFKVAPYQLEEVWVVELKQNLNELDVVNISESKVKEFEPETLSGNITRVIKQDYDINPGKYGVGPSGNIGWIVNKVGQLIRGKNEKERAGAISYGKLDTLFTDNSLFSSTLLLDQLKIPRERHNLFFAFCSTKNIKIELLEEDREFELLDLLLNYAEEFRNLWDKSVD